MKPATVIAALLISLIICGSAGAQATTGQQIQDKCKALVNQNSSFSGGFCAGFIDGVINSQWMWEASDKFHKQSHFLSLCLPQEGTNGQYLQVFLKYLDDHPEELHKPAALLLVESLAKAFPCGK